jgi:hypothetical protein
VSSSQLRICFGEVVEVPHIPNPSDELIDEYLEKLETSLRAVFDKHKVAAGYPDAVLQVK